MASSVNEALNRAAARTQRCLFPFQLDKWLHLGFIVFLAELGESGGRATLNVPGLPGGKSGSTGGGAPSTSEPWYQSLVDAFREHTLLVVVGGGALLLVVLAIGVFVLWVSSRGKFLLLEAVLYDSTHIREPWRRLRAPGWQLFKFRVAFVALGLALACSILAGASALAWPDVLALRFGSAALRGALLASSLVPLWLAAALFAALLEDFVVPLMYLHRSSPWQALRQFRTELFAGNAGAIALFYAIKLLLGVTFAMVSAFATCVTCCFAALPYVGTVLLLPYPVFMRSFSLYWLEQLGQPAFPEVPGPVAWQPTPDRFA